MNTEERLEALYKLLGSCMSRDPHVRAIAQVHAARSDFDLPTCLAEMVHCLAAEKERLAMDLTTAKIDQIESRMAARKAGLRRPTEYTQEIGGYDAEDAPSVNDQYRHTTLSGMGKGGAAPRRRESVYEPEDDNPSAGHGRGH